jgi:hypothetical protein
VYLRKNGSLNLYRDGNDLVRVGTGLDPTQLQHVRVEAFLSRIKVSVNGTLYILADDNAYSSGFFDLSVDSTTSRFNTLQVY